jgi:hypothetical protein
LVVRADGDDLDAERFELVELGLPGREIVGSDRREVGSIELDEHWLLAPELSETDRAAGRGGQTEVRRFLANLDAHGSIVKRSAERRSHDQSRTAQDRTSPQECNHRHSLRLITQFRGPIPTDPA